MPIRRSPNGARHGRPQPGRNRPEWVVAINWNAWSQSIGTGGRNHPVRAVSVANELCERSEANTPGTSRLNCFFRMLIALCLQINAFSLIILALRGKRWVNETA